MKYKGFAIVTMARTGSYLLVDLMNQINECHCLGEIFKPKFLELDDHFKKEIALRGWSKPMRDRRPIAYINEIYDILPTKQTGFKIFSCHNQKALNHVISNQNILTIFLYRNPISRYLSQLRAEATGVWIQNNIENNHNAEESDVRVVFEEDRFKYFVDECCNLKLMFEQRRHENKLFIEYDQVVDLTCINLICQKLDISRSATESVHHRLKKQINIPYKNFVANYQFMVSCLRDKYPDFLKHV